MTEKKSLQDASEEELEAELLRRRVKSSRRRPPRSLSDMELEAQHVEQVVGRSKLEASLAELPEEDTSAKPCPKCGKPTPVKGKKRRRILKTLSGKVSLVRNYHYCKSCKAGFYPRDQELGIPENGELSRELEKRVLDFAVNDTFAHGAERWSIHYRFPISANLLRRVADRVGAHCELARDEVLHPKLMPKPLSPSELLIVESDGGMVPLIGEWREAKVATLVRAENHLSNRTARRGQISEARYVAVLGQQDEFSSELEVALRVERAQSAKRVVWVGDGAPANWSLAQRLCPLATQVLDWAHAIQKGMDCGKVILGELSPLLPSWKERLEQLVASGEPDKLIRELLECIDDASAVELTALNNVVRYYRDNDKRMRYPAFIAEGFPIGSGIVESAHRHVIQTRMKKAGQHWSPLRARRMVRMRAAYRTAGPHRFHACIQAALAETRRLPPKAPKPKKPYASNR